MKALYSLFLMSAFALTANAQDAYDVGEFSSTDLNGTARYVGMGGALGALGADVSAIHSNPAGTGLYRSSDFNITMSGLFSNKGVLGHDASRLSVDNVGVVWAFNMDDSGEGLQYLNFGISYAKSRNHFSNFATAVDGYGKLFSQSCQVADLADSCMFNSDWGILADIAADNDGIAGGHVHDGFLEYEQIIKTKDGFEGRGFYGVPAVAGNYGRARFGNTSEVNLNISSNISDRLFLGATLGICSMNYTRQSFYNEVRDNGDTYEIQNWFKNTGNGVNLKLGFILRPIEDSPLRLGVSVHTPTWYSMTRSNKAEVIYVSGYRYTGFSYDFDYNYRTPWKLGASIGYTVGRDFAIGLEYEYMDMASSKYTNLDDYWSVGDEYYNAKRNLVVLNEAVQSIYKAQHTFKVGFEYKPDKDVSVRFGYNYVTSPFNSDSYKEIPYYSDMTETDWVNWKATQRFTVGLGFKISNSSYLDLAYQTQFQKGDLYAFNDWVTPDDGKTKIFFPPTEVNNDRSQLMVTLGFRF